MIRIVTLNIWQEQGEWERRLPLIARTLKSLAPDVVCLQEVREVPGRVPNQAETLARELGGWEHAYERAETWGGGDEGLAVLSRFPVVARDHQPLPRGERDCRRVCLGAAIQTPEGTAWVFTTHLAFRLDDGLTRERQVVAVDEFVKAHRQGSQTAAVLAGDFNACPDADEIRYLRGLTTLEGRRTYYQDSFALSNPGVPGHTWCRANPNTLALEWLEPDRRLDYVFVTPMTRRGVGRVHGARVVCSEAEPDGLRCTDHYGVMAEVTIGEPAPSEGG
jgi:endonuclease/exonuclease/phosphatase family metal-dependent hydrolase